MTPYPRIDPRTNQPLPPDFLVAQHPEAYGPQDHQTWRTLFERQTVLLRGRVVDEFYDGLDTLGITPDGIPDFREINGALAQATGWTVAAVPGLVPDAVFFSHLAARRFPAGYWIRKPDQLDYIEEPDIFHDVFGHVPLLMQPRYADYIAEYGRAGLAYVGQPALANLARLYWYTVEFGLMHAVGGLRIFGAGIISSAGEAVYSLESSAPARVGFDTERVLRTLYKIDDFQRIYFVLTGYDDLPELQTAALDRHIDAARRQHDIEPGQIVDTDAVIAAPGDPH
ncbi:MAG: phenylalanine 4-monooxygenase [Betaproteobacteria bacterium]|nr:phenylalanine 4-monooxygenase [Betaproteobacteria bacterium]